MSIRIFFFVVLLLTLAGCAGDFAHREGLSLLREGRSEEGIAKLEEAVREEPTNAQFRIDLHTRRAELVGRLLSSADSEQAAQKWEEAETLYRRVLRIEAANDRARNGLEAVARGRRHAQIVEEAKEAFKKGETEKALGIVSAIQAEDPANAEMLALKRQIGEQQAKQQIAEPTLKTLYTKPISLEFRDANLKTVVEVLARTTGVNFILDKDVRPDLRTTVFLKQSSLEDAIDLILATNRLEKKLLNRNTVLVYPNTPEKLKEYQELVVKGFYLANADAKQTQNVIKTLLKAKDTVIDEKLNLLVMRDTPEAIRLAEKLIAMQDLQEPEVMLEVEVLEVKRSRLLEIGIKYPEQLTLSALPSSGTTLTLFDLKNIDSRHIGAALPNTAINLRREISDANILANPRIRARNREKAKIMIGDKVPVITTTSTATGFVSENIQYLDVGLKLEVEPDVHLQDDVAIKVGLEVSSIVKEVRTSSGALSYQIGTRNASTVLRLKAGETQILAGLISDEDRTAANRVPGIGDLPVLGRLFSSQKDDRQKTEIVLSITPRLVRNLNRPDPTAGEFWSGTETTLKTRPLRLQGLTGGETPAPGAGAPGGGPSQSSAGASETPASGELSFINLSWQGPTQAKVGDQIKLALRVKTDGALRSMPFQVAVDPAAFQIVDVSEGGFFKQGDVKTSFSASIDQAAGKAFAGAARSGQDGASGEDTVAVLTLRAIGTKPQAEIKLLTVAPIASGDKTVSPTIPAPHVIAVTQ